MFKEGDRVLAHGGSAGAFGGRVGTVFCHIREGKDSYSGVSFAGQNWYIYDRDLSLEKVEPEEYESWFVN